MIYLPMVQRFRPFSCTPHHASLDEDKILCNDVNLPGEFNPHNVRLWVIGDVFGAIVAVWASHAQEAFDVACDEYMLDGYLSENQEWKDEEEGIRCGNASELFDFDQPWIGVVKWNELDEKTKLAFAYSKGACFETLRYP